MNSCRTCRYYLPKRCDCLQYDGSDLAGRLLDGLIGRCDEWKGESGPITQPEAANPHPIPAFQHDAAAIYELTVPQQIETVFREAREGKRSLESLRKWVHELAESLCDQR